MERKNWVILYDDDFYDEVYDAFGNAVAWADSQLHVHGGYRIIEMR